MVLVVVMGFVDDSCSESLSNNTNFKILKNVTTSFVKVHSIQAWYFVETMKAIAPMPSGHCLGAMKLTNLLYQRDNELVPLLFQNLCSVKISF